MSAAGEAQARRARRRAIAHTADSTVQRSSVHVVEAA